jgi:hypothetical protein
MYRFAFRRSLGCMTSVSDRSVRLIVKEFVSKVSEQSNRHRSNVSLSNAYKFISSIPEKTLVDLVTAYANHADVATAQQVLDHSEADFVEYLAMAVALSKTEGDVTVFGSGLTRFNSVSGDPAQSVASAQLAFDDIAATSRAIMLASQARLDHAFVLSELMRTDGTAGQDSTAFARACQLRGEPLEIDVPKSAAS